MAHNHQHPNKNIHLMLGAIGIVYGDIGTSPLYTVKECFTEANFALTHSSILGILSLIFWAITIIVAFKYVVLILRADNHGEGGILALMALCLRSQNAKTYKIILTLGLVGAALFYGDAVITPAISVLSAVEGLSLYSPTLSAYIIPLTIIILIILFWIQANGTASLGNLFGPAMVVWFALIAILGLIQIIKTPAILQALNPYHAWHLMSENGWGALTILGSVVLAITGAEALYADMGHFGRTAIQRAWYYFIYPALILNYFGQGGLLLTNVNAIDNPFYLLAPDWGLLPMIIISTIATIIASQAVISGIFSISWQAIQFGYLPRMRVDHTSEYIGQVYVPTINKIICFLTIILVISFGNSGNLASAYGFAVTGIMVITTTLTAFLALQQWKWPLWSVTVIFSFLLGIDLILFGTNTSKLFDGAWLPIISAIGVFVIMTTWLRGRMILMDHITNAGKTIKGFMRQIKTQAPIRVPGTAVYMTSSPTNLPNSFTINFKHNRVLHQKVIFLTIITEDVPRVPRCEKVLVKDLGFNIYQVTCHYGFKEIPSINYIFEKCDESGLCIDISETSFFMSRGIPVASIHPHFPRWRERLFIFLARNAANAIEFYKIPHNRVVELGIRLKL